MAATAVGVLAPPPNLSQICVMVVDPSSHSRAATVKLLEETGYKVRDGPVLGIVKPSGVHAAPVGLKV